jgi:hypothetical protein
MICVTEDIENERFWRIAATSHFDNFLLASSTFVRTYDTRVGYPLLVQILLQLKVC